MRHLIAAILSVVLLSPCAVLAQASSSASSSAASQTKERDTLEPAVDTSAPASQDSGAAAAKRSTADTRSAAPQARSAEEPRSEGDAASATAASAPTGQAKSGKAMDHLQLGTTDITGNRELPKVLYIVPWKASNLGDLTGKPLNSLVDETLQPIDRDVFKRENRYYGAVAQKGSGPAAAGEADADRRGDQPQSPAAGDER